MSHQTGIQGKFNISTYYKMLEESRKLNGSHDKDCP